MKKTPERLNSSTPSVAFTQTSLQAPDGTVPERTESLARVPTSQGATVLRTLKNRIRRVNPGTDSG